MIEPEQPNEHVLKSIMLLQNPECLSPPLGYVSEHEQIQYLLLRMCYRMSEISRHPVVAATRALRFADHVTKRNEGSGNENDRAPVRQQP